MNDFSVHMQVADAMLAIEAELRRLGLWSATVPDAEALASTLPFCCDTLNIEGWLQFVFLPRMAQLVAEGAALPPRSAVRPMLEERVRAPGADTTALLTLVGDLDALLNR